MVRKIIIYSNLYLSGFSEVYIYLMNGVWVNFYLIMMINFIFGYLYYDFSISNVYIVFDI